MFVWSMVIDFILCLSFTSYQKILTLKMCSWRLNKFAKQITCWSGQSHGHKQMSCEKSLKSFFPKTILFGSHFRRFQFYSDLCVYGYAGNVAISDLEGEISDLSSNPSQVHCLLSLGKPMNPSPSDGLSRSQTVFYSLLWQPV